jgi:hypothetical protein
MRGFTATSHHNSGTMTHAGHSIPLLWRASSRPLFEKGGSAKRQTRVTA